MISCFIFRISKWFFFIPIYSFLISAWFISLVVVVVVVVVLNPCYFCLYLLEEFSIVILKIIFRMHYFHFL